MNSQKRFRRVLEVRHHNERNARRRLCNHRDFAGNLRSSDACAMSVEDYDNSVGKAPCLLSSLMLAKNSTVHWDR